MLNALAFAARGVEIRFQHPVRVAEKLWLVDAYFPALRLAVEVDEGHHIGQIEADGARAGAISQALDCTFERIDCHSQPVFPQLDRLVAKIKQRCAELALPAWHPPAPEIRTLGIYSGRHLELLERTGALADVTALAQQVEALGVMVDLKKRFNGLPDRENGNAGLTFSVHGVGFILYTRATRGGFKLLVQGAPSNSGERLKSAGFELKPHQPNWPSGGPRYLTLSCFQTSQPPEEILRKLAEVLGRLDSPVAP